MKQFGRGRRLAARQRRHTQEVQVKKMLVISFTDGRNTEAIAFDGSRDTPETVRLFCARMKDNGWVPVKGSDRIVEIENGVARPYVAHPKMRPVWQVA